MLIGRACRCFCLLTKWYGAATTYQWAKAVTTLRQNVTMGIKKGNIVLLCFQSNGSQFQAVLMIVDSLPGSKGGEQQHKLWKHMIPRLIEFAWLPADLATAFCNNALQLDPQRPYGAIDEVLTLYRGWQTIITLDQLYPEVHTSLRSLSTCFLSACG